jgi:transcriptional regulator with XRE-family HTH domain
MELGALASNFSRLTEIERYIMEKVKEKRVELNLTQFDLSLKLGKSESFVAQVENDRNGNKYNINHLNALAKIFNCSIKDFLPDSPL